ncbi:MAG: MMPL family transporter [Planctomycetales bacterium]
MTHFFEKRDRWGHGYGLWVLAAMLFLVPLAGWSLQQTRLENDVENWLPADDPQAATLGWYHKHFPPEERLLVSWDDSSLDDPRVARFAELLEGKKGTDGLRRNGIPELRSVVTPQELIARMRQPNVGGERVSQEEAIRRLQGVLVGPGKLKVRLTETGRQMPDRARDLLLQAARDEIGIVPAAYPPAPRPESLEDESFEGEPDAVAEQSPSGEPTAEELADEEAALLEAEDEPVVDRQGLPYREHDFQVAWPGMHTRPGQIEEFQKLAARLKGRLTPRTPSESPLVAETFLVAGSPIALSITLSEAGGADRETAFRKIREAAERAGIPRDGVRMGGQPVAGHELNVAVKQAASNPEHSWLALHRRSPILLSCLVGVAIASVMLRNVRLAMLVLASALYTMLVSVAIVPVTGGSMNMVLVVMPTLLMVLTLSAAIHVANYWKNAAHKDLATSVVEAVRTARTPCTLAAVTTAIGLMSLATSPLAPVRDFGLYSAIGCLISLGVVLYGLPAMLQCWPAAPPRLEEIDRAAWRRLGGLLCRHAKAVVAVCVVAFVAGTCGLYWFRTEIKVIRYFPDDSRVVRDYEFLEEQLSGIVPVQTVVRFDADAQQELTFAQRLEIVRTVEERMREHPEISGTLSLADFVPVLPDAGDGFLSRRRAFRTSTEVENAIKGTAAAKSFLVAATGPARLPGPEGRVLNEAGDELWRITAQVAIMSDLDYGELVGSEPHYAAMAGNLNHIARSVLKEYGGADHVVTGTVPVFLRTQQAVLESLIRSFGLAFVLIALVMMVLLKDPLAGLLTMLPNLLPVGLVFGLVSWAGLAVDVGTMITASVALGIAVDGTLHLLTWFRAGIRDGLSRTEAIKTALAHCGPAMWQTSAAIGFGLLMLSYVDLLLISRFGWLMAALIGAALVADIVFLPALLAGPLGALLERSAGVAMRPGKPAPSPPSAPLNPHLEPGARTASGKIIRID